jgi:iron complex outermembrane receptor protein
MNLRTLAGGAALTALSLGIGGEALAQSTASQIQEEEIVVTAQRRSVEGVMSAEQLAKARSTITQEFIETQSPGQTILQSVNLIPGVNFTNNDPFGSSGGNLRIRGFDNNRISLTFDGVPLNDTGNYAIFSNQQLDPELITRANVNQGTTDVDSPTASATGGTVNYVTRKPSDTPGLMVSPAVGSHGYYRLFGLADTGEIGPLGTTVFVAGSYQFYDQFVGPGSLEKKQFNARVYQPLADSDFISVSFHWNTNRNNFYRQGSFAEFAANPELSNFDTCVRLPGGAGAQNEGTGNANDPATPAACTNYYGLRINPSDTGNIRGQSSFSLGDSLTLTFDPSFQYVMANGGGTTVISETDARLRGAAAAGDSINPSCGALPVGVDLNGDCDVVDSVRLYSPSNTNTRRYGVLSSLIWDLTETQRIRVGYTWDYGRHRQTGEYGLLDSLGDPLNVYAGKEGWGGPPILTADGRVFQKRDRFSIASLSQWNAEYRGDFFDNAVTLNVGVRAPQFERQLNQFCFSQAGSTADPTCTSGPAPVGNFVAPFRTTVQYDDVLPNAGITWRPGEGHQIFFSYAEGLSAPRTDDLYNGLTIDQLREVEPETSQAYDLGYRFQGGMALFSVTGWYNMFQNRIVRVFDQDQGINISRNVGDVDLWGVDTELGLQPTEDLTLYFSASWTDSEIKDDLRVSSTLVALTGGKRLVETPDWTLAARGEYELGPVTLGAQAKYVGDRFATDVNDQVAPAYTTVDLDLRWDLGRAWRNEGTYFQLNVINVLDEEYFGSIATQIAATPNTPGAGTVRYNLGAPRTVLLTLRTEF